MRPDPVAQAGSTLPAGPTTQAGPGSQAGSASKPGPTGHGEPPTALSKPDPHITGQRTRPTASQVDPGSDTRPTASQADPGSDTRPAGDAEPSDKDGAGKRKPDGSLSRLAAYKAEVAELLGGDSAARRRRKNTTPSGLPAPDPASQEPPIKLTRPPRKGGTRSKD